MTDEDFDKALIAAAFGAIARDGWLRFTPAAAAQEAGLPLDRARLRMPTRAALLHAFGALADRAALAEADITGSVQERLFGMLMGRIDVMQTHREGVSALLRALPMDPAAAFTLSAASLGSMRWMLQAAGVPAGGALGMVRAEGLLAVWLWTVRLWLNDQSADLSATMAGLDTALGRAAQIARMLPGGEGAGSEIADTEAPAVLSADETQPLPP